MVESILRLFSLLPRLFMALLVGRMLYNFCLQQFMQARFWKLDVICVNLPWLMVGDFNDVTGVVVRNLVVLNRCWGGVMLLTI